MSYSLVYSAKPNSTPSILKYDQNTHIPVCTVKSCAKLIDAIFAHVFKYRETWTNPVHFTGSVAFAFKDILKQMCEAREIKTGKFMKDPMEGLIHFHQS